MQYLIHIYIGFGTSFYSVNVDYNRWVIVSKEQEAARQLFFLYGTIAIGIYMILDAKH